jgi:hypothetical protein
MGLGGADLLCVFRALIVLGVTLARKAKSTTVR